MKRRILSVVMALTLVLSLCPEGSVLAEESVQPSCPHQREHTADCGYSEEDRMSCGYECRICPIEDLNGGAFIGTSEYGNAIFDSLPLGGLLDTSKAILKADGTGVARTEINTGTFTGQDNDLTAAVEGNVVTLSENGTSLGTVTFTFPETYGKLVTATNTWNGSGSGSADDYVVYVELKGGGWVRQPG